MKFQISIGAFYMLQPIVDRYPRLESHGVVVVGDEFVNACLPETDHCLQTQLWRATRHR